MEVNIDGHTPNKRKLMFSNNLRTGSKIMEHYGERYSSKVSCPGCVHDGYSYDKHEIAGLIDTALHELYFIEKVQYSPGRIDKVERQTVNGFLYYITFEATRTDCRTEKSKCPVAECHTEIVQKYKERLHNVEVLCVECMMDHT